MRLVPAGADDVDRAPGHVHPQRDAWASIASAMPEISAGVSPFARSATRNPASCAGVASPAKT